MKAFSFYSGLVSFFLVNPVEWLCSGGYADFSFSWKGVVSSLTMVYTWFCDHVLWPFVFFPLMKCLVLLEEKKSIFN